jgi:hypothetical protein
VQLVPILKQLLPVVDQLVPIFRQLVPVVELWHPVPEHGSGGVVLVVRHVQLDLRQSDNLGTMITLAQPRETTWAQ